MKIKRSVLICLLCLYFVSCRDNFKHKDESVENLKDAFNSYITHMEENPEDMSDSNYNNLSSVLINEFDKKILVSEGMEKRVLQRIREIQLIIDSVNRKWIYTKEKAMEPEVTNFFLMKEKSDFDKSLQTIEDYINESKNNKLFFLDRLNFLERKTFDLDQNNMTLIGYKKGAKVMQRNQMLIYPSLIDAHMKYGKSIKRMLLLLRDDIGNWIDDGEEVLFNNEETLRNYGDLYYEQVDLGQQIDSLNERLLYVTKYYNSKL